MVVMHWNGAAAATARASRPSRSRSSARASPSTPAASRIKPAAGMEDMKWDMAGAGTVIGLMAALAGAQGEGQRGRPRRPGREHAVRHRAAAGRRGEDLFRADDRGDQHRRRGPARAGRRALVLPAERFKPRFMVDLATLTGAIIVALGHEIRRPVRQRRRAGRAAASRPARRSARRCGACRWTRPTTSRSSQRHRRHEEHRRPRRPARSPRRSSCSASSTSKPWAHLDIAGIAWSSKDAPTVPKGATAFGVRLLDRLVADNYEA